MYRHTIKYKYSKGLSVIELMVAMLIVSVLLLGVTTVYRASKQSYRLNDEVAELQENARFAFHNSTHEIRMAGYSGCTRIPDIISDSSNITVLSTDIPIGYEKALTGNTFIKGHNFAKPNWVATGMVAAPGDWDNNSSAITILKASACSTGLTAEATPTGLVPINVAIDCGFKKGDFVMITDCEYTDLFTVSGFGAGGELLHNPPDNKTPAQLSHTYKIENTHVHKLERATYYISLGDTKSTPPILPGLTQLSYVNSALGGGKTEIVLKPRSLVPYASNMLITYGIDVSNNGSVDNFYTADQVDGVAITKKLDPAETPWSRVRSVTIRYDIADDPAAAGSLLKGKPFSFSTTINLRNNTP